MSGWFLSPRKSFSDRATVLVVGAGAGGSIAALTLAEAGIDVVVIEEGFHQPPESSPYAISPAMDAMYQEGGWRTMTGQPPIPLVGGRGLGGSTLVNSAICFRTPERTVDEWNAMSGGAFDDTDEFYRAQDDLEALIRVAATPDHLLSGYDRAHKDGAQRLGWHEHNLRRNTPGCIGCCRCHLSCPVGGKASMDVVALPRVAATGARVYSGCRVDTLQPGKVSGVVIDAHDKILGSFEVRADKIVLAGGAVATPRLLLNSGMVDTRGPVGRGLQVHPVANTLGYLPDRDCIQMGAAQGHCVIEFADDDIVLESNPIIPAVLFAGLPLHGVEGMKLLSKSKHFASTGAMVRDNGEGRVLPSSGVGAKVHYSLSFGDRDRLLRGIRHSAQLWLEGAGAHMVGFSVYGSPMCRNMDDVIAHTPMDMDPGRVVGYSSHPQASCRMGSACDTQGQVIEAPGYYCMDASVFPRNVGRNPQISVMTVSRVLSTRLAHSLGEEVKPLWAGSVERPAPVHQPGIPCGLGRSWQGAD